MASVHSIVTPRISKGKRPLIDNGDGTHSVPLTQGLFALIDSDLAGIIGQYNWCLSNSGSNRYVVTWVQLNGKQSPLMLHHLVAGRPLGKLEIDHANRNPLDNRRSNLRVVSHRDNNCNRKKSNSTGFLGVKAEGRRFSAAISVEDKDVYLGMFATAEQAAKIHDAAREILGHDPQFGNHLPLSLEHYYEARGRIRSKFAVRIARGDRTPVRIMIACRS